MFTLTQLGNGFFLIPLIVVSILIFDRKNALLILVISLITIFLGGIVVHILKELIQRPRPLSQFMDMNIYGQKLYVGSFPSGHSQTAFSTAAVLSGYYKKWLLFYLLAFLVAFSRVYIGVHYPLDIVAGSMIGYLSAKLILIISQRLDFKKAS
ncbi:MAG: phosphatase PAP2 family protein [bacterium]|nr:phosphatase PAP2 family protein [bacterium]